MSPFSAASSLSLASSPPSPAAKCFLTLTLLPAPRSNLDTAGSCHHRTGPQDVLPSSALCKDKPVPFTTVHALGLRYGSAILSFHLPSPSYRCLLLSLGPTSSRKPSLTILVHSKESPCSYKSAGDSTTSPPRLPVTWLCFLLLWSQNSQGQGKVLTALAPGAL